MIVHLWLIMHKIYSYELMFVIEKSIRYIFNDRVYNFLSSNELPFQIIQQ